MNALAAINVSTASLPQTYQTAKNALVECASIDECKDWSDKAAALASYAKQAEDDQLERMAQRIRARAIRRAGEILKQVEPQKGGDRKSDEYQSAAADTLITRKEVAQRAGMSKRQAVTAIRVASIPTEIFEDCVEDSEPMTVTALAALGTKTKSQPSASPQPIIDLKGRDPKEFNRCMHFIGMLENHLRDFSGFDMDFIFSSLVDSEKAEVRALVGKLDVIHDQIVTRI